MHFTDAGDDNGLCLVLFMSGIWMNKYQLSTDELWKYDLNAIYHVHVLAPQINTCKIIQAKNNVQHPNNV